MVARFVGDGVVVAEDTVELHMNALAARQFDARKRDVLRKALAQDLGRRLRIEVVVTDGEDAVKSTGTASESPRSGAEGGAGGRADGGTDGDGTGAGDAPAGTATGGPTGDAGPGSASGGGGGGAAPGRGGTLPGIVEKAIELFHGSLHGSPPPPRPGP